MKLEIDECIAFLEEVKQTKDTTISDAYEDGVSCAWFCINDSINLRIELLKEGVFSPVECITSLIAVLESDCRDKDNTDFGKGFKNVGNLVIEKLKAKLYE
ncbi:MAG: hypothetical protein IJW54_02495 [Clostridia bacterium]|nr:hypothetical protein [Clostridia bacterium]